MKNMIFEFCLKSCHRPIPEDYFFPYCQTQPFKDRGRHGCALTINEMSQFYRDTTYFFFSVSTIVIFDLCSSMMMMMMMMMMSLFSFETFWGFSRLCSFQFLGRCWWTVHGTRPNSTSDCFLAERLTPGQRSAVTGHWQWLPRRRIHPFLEVGVYTVICPVWFWVLKKYLG